MRIGHLGVHNESKLRVVFTFLASNLNVPGKYGFVDKTIISK